MEINNFRIGKRMLEEKAWNSLVTWHEERLLFGKPTTMPRKKQELGTIAFQGCEGEWKGGKMIDVDTSGEKEIEEDEGKERIDELAESKESKESKGSRGEIREAIAATKAALVRIEQQEKKTTELIQSVNKLCEISSQALSQCQESVRKIETVATNANEMMSEVRKELVLWREERSAEGQRSRDLRQTVRQDYATQIQRVYEMVNQLSDSYNKLDKGEKRKDHGERSSEQQYEVRDPREKDPKPNVGKHDSLNDVGGSDFKKEIANAVRSEIENLGNIKVSQFKDRENKDTLKLEIVNSELRACGPLHVISDKDNVGGIDENILREQRFKARDVIINRHY
ncbi:uncharacterized protein LOC117611020 [Osmia lignaria lignaria]|uniref:uncharacterized protein LOC117611020 n=1 Tax=Osmia lignaria lignaria TaxID=1437193 RepID=UPI00402B47F1